MNIIAGTTSQFQNINRLFENTPKLDKLFNKTSSRYMHIKKDLEKLTEEDILNGYKSVNDDEFDTLTIINYEKTSISLIPVSHYKFYVDEHKNLYLSLLPKDINDASKILRNIKNTLKNAPENYFHEAYHLISSVPPKNDKELQDSYIDILSDEEEIIALYMEIMLLMEVYGLNFYEISQRIEIFNENIEEMNKFFELTSKYRK